MKDYFAHETAVLDEGCKIGAGTRIWHFTHVMPKAVIGRNCILGQNVMVANKATVGDNVKIQNNVSVYEGVTCENDVFLGPSMVFTNVLNPRAFIERKHEFRTTLVRQGASIGANATIVCGHTIGRYALIGAGSVVTHDIPDYALVTGNPAKQTGWVSEHGCTLTFDKTGFATCPESGEKYQLVENQVKRIE